MTTKEWAALLRDAAQRAPGGPAPQVAVRGSVRTRGGAAPTRPSAGSLQEVVSRLLDQATTVRLEVVGELIKQADDVALTVLRALAEQPDPDPNVRWAIADGLAGVQHAEAIRLMEWLARHDPDETVQTCAIGSLGKRALAAYRTQVGSEKATPHELVRVRGAVRTRGASPIRKISREAEVILDLLDQLRTSETSDYVRDMADLTLRQLGE
jgi:hypothetical protein